MILIGELGLSKTTDKCQESKPNPILKTSAVKGKMEEKSSSCVTNCQKPIVKAEPFLDEQINTPRVLEDMEVEIVSWTNKGDFLSNQNEDPDATEYSSSFADTTSDTEMCSRPSEAEVESEFLGDNGLPCTFDAFGSAFRTRKKKLTDHWRNFIRPLMWRCKWMELRIKEIESQALKYSRELADYDQRKSTRLDHFALEECGSKSFPFPSHQYRPKIKKRRKRKKVEDTTEITSYMSHHFLFSYLENKKSDPDGCLAGDFGIRVKAELHTDLTDRFGFNDDQSFFEFGDGDISTEQLLWSIETVHTRVQKLKSRVDTIMSKNALKFSSSENLSLLVLPNGDVQISSAHSPTFSAVNGDTVSVRAIYNSVQHVPEFDLVDLGPPDSAVLSYGEATSIPDIIESTVGLLSAADVTLHRPQAGDLGEHMVDNVLIHNEVSEKGEQGESADPAAITTESSIPSKFAVSQDQSKLRSYLYNDVQFPKNKRKRGERKAGSGGWNKKGSGEHDGQ